jgi:hypothetical protein
LGFNPTWELFLLPLLPPLLQVLATLLEVLLNDRVRGLLISEQPSKEIDKVHAILVG